MGFFSSIGRRFRTAAGDTSSASHSRAQNARTSPTNAGSQSSQPGPLAGRNAGSSRAEGPLPRRQPSSALLPARRLAASESQQTVKEVLDFVRQTYYKPHLKSGNKVKISGGPVEERRQALATQEVLRIRKQRNYLAAAMSGRAHHCGELALLAIHRLQEHHGLEARSLLLGTCGDREPVGEEGEEEQDAVHEVAVIGPASNPLPADMTTWHPDVYVCDPWSNIACRARDYPGEFVAKMEKWERDGKAVGFAPEGFVLPSNEAWIGSVLQGPKMASSVDLPSAS